MIKQFKDEYRFLSNFWFSQIEFEGIIYQTNEHAYQAAKTLDQNVRIFVASLPKPGDAKKYGRRIKLRPDWESVKFDIMYQINLDKYTSNLYLRRKLLDTGNEHLQEGNMWGDTIWGVDLRTGKGENNLGKILMRIRDELRGER